MFRVLQIVLINDFCGSSLNVYKHDISLILIGYIHRLCRHLHQSPFSISLSTAASRRASRPRYLAITSFAPSTVFIAIFPPPPFCVYIFFFLSCLSGPRIRFLPTSGAVRAAVDGGACSAGGRIGGINERGGIIIEARSGTYLPQVSSN